MKTFTFAKTCISTVCCFKNIGKLEEEVHVTIKEEHGGGSCGDGTILYFDCIIINILIAILHHRFTRCTCKLCISLQVHMYVQLSESFKVSLIKNMVITCM